LGFLLGFSGLLRRRKDETKDNKKQFRKHLGLLVDRHGPGWAQTSTWSNRMPSAPAGRRRTAAPPMITDHGAPVSAEESIVAQQSRGVRRAPPLAPVRRSG